MNGENKESVGKKIAVGIFTGILSLALAAFVFVVMYY